MALTIKDIANKLADEFGITKTQATKEVKFVLEQIKNNIKKESVKLYHFGTFTTTKRKGSINGKEYNVDIVRFKPSKILKNRVR